jgi:hypothetical protein
MSRCRGRNNVAIKRIVSTQFWEDEKVINEFTPEDKYFFLYLLTNPRSTLLGIYRLVPKQAAFELGYSPDAVNILLERFEHKYGIICYNPDTCEVAIRNYLRHGIVSGGTPVLAQLHKDAAVIKDRSLLEYVLEANQANPNQTVREFVLAVQGDGTNGDGNGDGNGNGYVYGDSCPNRSRIVPDSQTDKNNSKHTKFSVPTVDEVRAYCTERNNRIDAERFVDYYTANGWKVGRNPMKNWKAAVHTWEKNDKQGKAKHVGFQNYDQGLDDEPILYAGPDLLAEARKLRESEERSNHEIQHI